MTYLNCHPFSPIFTHLYPFSPAFFFCTFIVVEVMVAMDNLGNIAWICDLMAGRKKLGEYGQCGPHLAYLPSEYIHRTKSAGVDQTWLTFHPNTSIGPSLQGLWLMLLRHRPPTSLARLSICCSRSGIVALGQVVMPCITSCSIPQTKWVKYVGSAGN